MDHFIKELQENDNFHDYNYMYFVKFRKKNIGIHNMAVCIQICVIMRLVTKGLHSMIYKIYFNFCYSKVYLY